MRGTVSWAAWTAVLLAMPAQGVEWIPTRVAPPDRTEHAAAYDSRRDRLVIVGGNARIGAGTYYAPDAWEFDGVTWRSCPSVPASVSQRFGHAMAYDTYRGVVVLVGGREVMSMFDTWEYDGSVWVAGPPSPATPRFDHAMAYDVGRRCMVLYGGNSGGPSGLGDVWEYDGADWMPGVSPSAAMAPRWGHAMTYDSVRGRIVVFGGNDAVTRFRDTWLYDGASWMSGPPGPPGLTARTESALAFDERRGVAVLFGGDDGSLRDDTWEYDGLAWRSGTATVTDLAPRSGHTLVHASGWARTVLFAGADGAQERNDTWLLGPSGWQEAVGVPYVADGHDHAITYDASRGVVLLVGGQDATDVNTWEYDGTQWAKGAALPPSLVGRFGHAMVYDTVRRRAVLFGGIQGAWMNDTWEHDGAAWTLGAAAPALLTPRQGHAMAFDSMRGKTVLFGGQTLPGNADDTWELDGGGWAPGAVAPAAMAARWGHAMAFDARRSRTVLFGGSNIDRRTWEYDGISWVEGATGPAAMGELLVPGMAFDAMRGVILLFGGYAYYSWSWPVVLWEYDGAQWTQGVAPPAALLGRVGGTLAFDASRGRVVLFGGGNDFSGDGNLNDTWELGDPIDDYVLGAGLGPTNLNRVRVAYETGVLTTVDFQAYAAGKWGTNVAAGPIDGSGYDAILTGPGPGAVYGPAVHAYRRDGSLIAKVNFYAYGTLRYGVNVAEGDIEDDGYAEIVTGAGPGAVFGPHVRAFDYDGTAVAPLAKVSFYAFATLKYGANVTSGSVDADPFAELAVGPGPGASFAPLVRGFNYDASAIAAIAKINFWAFSVLQYGATLAAGDVDADGFAEIVASPGPGGSASFPAQFRGFNYDGTTLAALAGYDVVPLPSLYGGRPGLGNVRGSAAAELLAGAGPDPSADSRMESYRYRSASLDRLPSGFTPFPWTSYGVVVAGGRLGL